MRPTLHCVRSATETLTVDTLYNTSVICNLSVNVDTSQMMKTFQAFILQTEKRQDEKGEERQKTLLLETQER